jgi:hypothetical protein
LCLLLLFFDISDITCNVIDTNVTNRFHLNNANDEEKNVEKLGSEGILNRKTIIFTARINDIIKMKSIGDVGVDDITCDVAYVHISFFRVRISCIFFSLSSVRLLTKEPSSLRVCSRSNIAGKHHKSSKLFKAHSTMSLEDYKELPTVVQTLNYHCVDHDEKFDSFCPVHNRPCCIRCAPLSSVRLLTKEPSSLRVCSRSNIAGADLTFGIKSFIGAIPEHSLCEVRAHLIQHGRLWTGQNESSFSS